MLEKIKEKKLTLWETFWLAKTFFKENFKSFFILWLIIWVPLTVLWIFFPIDDNANEWVNTVYSIVVWISLFTVITFTWNKIEQKESWMQQWFRIAGKKILIIFGTSLLMGLALIPLYILLIIPWIIFSVYWGFIIQAILLRDKKFFKAMSYSKSVIKWFWWNYVGKSFLLWTIWFLIIAIPFFTLGFAVEMFYLSDFIELVLTEILSTIILIPIQIFSAIFWVIMFFNYEALNTKKESKEEIVV